MKISCFFTELGKIAPGNGGGRGVAGAPLAPPFSTALLLHVQHYFKVDLH